MKYLMMILFLSSLSGCASMGTILKGAGDGMVNAQTEKAPTKLKGDSNGGFYTADGYHCTPDFAGGYNCY